jgi:PPM family protein phosphatase
MNLALRYSATSDVGRVRRNNQDSGFASEHLLVVADGMGGAAAGDIASAETIQVMRRLHGAHPDDMLGALAGAVQRANDRLGEIVEEDPSVEGMGTTVTAVMFDGDTMGLAHIGDSRAYLLRDGKLTQLTQDHTFVQGLVDEGRITETEARSHPHRSLLLRALDGRHDAEPDLSTFEVHPGDRLLICSDGLCGYVDDEAIERGLESGTPDEAARGLLQMALDAGGPDNVTTVIGDVVDAGAAVAAGAATGPMVVGAAAERARHRRQTDTATQPAVGVDTGPGADPEELRYAPRAPHRFRWLRRLALLVVVLGLLGLAGKAAYDWTQGQYYVADSGQNVAIYRGIRADVPLVPLSSLYSTSDVQVSTLPGWAQSRVRQGIDATNLPNARNIVRQLQDASSACDESQPKSSEPSEPSPDASPREQPTAGQGGGRSDRTDDRQGARTNDTRASASGSRSSAEPTAKPSRDAGGSGSGEPTSQPSANPDCPGATS